MMESLSDHLLIFKPNSLDIVRKMCNFENRKQMNEAIDILEVWIKQQNHFTKKEFNREFLERCIIRSKGSIEKSKERLDKMCTGKTHLPQYFGVYDVRKFELDAIKDFILPKMTKDYDRVYILRNDGQEFGANVFMDYYRRMVYFFEYYCAYDYSNGLVIVLDYMHVNTIEFIKRLDVVQLGHASSFGINGYGLRIKGIHVISQSKLISVFVTMLKQVLSDKLKSRIQLHSDTESLKKYLDEDILPVEYGGKEISIDELHAKWLDALSTPEFLDYIEKANEAKVDEALRPADTESDTFSGVTGTFRSLAVD